MPQRKGVVNVGKLRGDTLDRDMRIWELVTRAGESYEAAGESANTTRGTAYNAVKRISAIMAIGAAHHDATSAIVEEHGVSRKQLLDIARIWQLKNPTT